jgi:hypothetical protein
MFLGKKVHKTPCQPSQAWSYVPVITATWEAVSTKVEVQARSLKNNLKKKPKGSEAQLKWQSTCLASKGPSNSSTAKNKKQKQKKLAIHFLNCDKNHNYHDNMELA